MPFSGSVKTYNVDYQTPDSAATATAYLCGIKGTYYTAGVNAAVGRKECDAIKGNEIESVLKKAKRAGKGTGIVTTTRINHASPSGAYAHSSYRKWYDDTDLEEEEDMTAEDKKNCVDLATQFVENQHLIDVMMGGGVKHFCPEKHPDYEKHECYRRDGKDYIGQFKADETIDYLSNRQELLNLTKTGTSKSIVGLFAPKELSYEAEKRNNKELDEKEPTLSEMTALALQRLQQEKNGFYLFVEGGRIDHGHHDNTPIRALYEFVEFEKTIRETLQKVDPEETLILVSADHSHQFTFGGYGLRRSDVFGVGTHQAYPVAWEPPLDTSTDKENVFIINYADGPGFRVKNTKTEDGQDKCGRVPPSDVMDKLSNPLDNDGEHMYPGTAFSDYSSHGGEDVSLQGIGPWAHLVTGNHEQTFVAGLTEFALCVGDYQNEAHCTEESDSSRVLAVNTALFMLILTW